MADFMKLMLISTQADDVVEVGVELATTSCFSDGLFESNIQRTDRISMQVLHKHLLGEGFPSWESILMYIHGSLLSLWKLYKVCKKYQRIKSILISIGSQPRKVVVTVVVVVVAVFVFVIIIGHRNLTLKFNQNWVNNK